MFSENTVILAGKVCGEHRVFTNEDGSVMLSFSMNTPRRNRADDSVRHTFHRVNYRGSRAEGLSQFIHKGMPIVVRGILDYRRETDPDGTSRQGQAFVLAFSVSVPAKDTNGGNGGPAPEAETADAVAQPVTAGTPAPADTTSAEEDDLF